MSTIIESGELATKQTLYSTRMLPKISEDSTDKLSKYGMMVTGEGGKAEFYIIGESDVTYTNGDISKGTGKDGEPLNLYTNDGDADSGMSFEVEMEEVSAGENISAQKVKSTKVGVSSAIMNKQVRKLQRKKVNQIIEAIDAVKTDASYTAKVKEVALTGKIEDEGNVLEIISQVFLAISLSENAEEHRNDVAVVMNSADHAKLFKSKEFLSSDFSGMVGKGGMKNINSAEFITYNKLSKIPAGKIRIIPADSFGIGETEDNSTSATLDWAPGIRKYQAVAAVTRAVAVTDPEAITEITITAS